MSHTGNAQPPKRKPLTHCEKYGHTWVASTSDGWDICNYVSYDNKGHAHPCTATRRRDVIYAASPATPSQPSSPVAQQPSLFS